jgi:hypothetical protein
MLTALFLFVTRVVTDNSFIRLISDKVTISDSNVVEYISALDSPVINKYTVFGWVQFSGTENRLYNILKFRNINSNSATDFPDSLNSILSISYSYNQIDGNQFIAVVYANGPKQTDSLAKIIDGPILQDGAWNFFAVTTDHDNQKSTIYIKIFDKDALEASYDIALNYTDTKIQSKYSIFLGKNNDPPNNNENFKGLFYNFYFINNFIARPEILYLFNSSPSLDQFRGIYMEIPFYTLNNNVTTTGFYKSPISWTNVVIPQNYTSALNFKFLKESSAVISQVQMDLMTKVISSVILYIKFRFVEPISDEYVILRFGEVGQPNSVVVSLVEELKETNSKTFSQNLNFSDSLSQSAVSSYVYKPELKMPKRIKIQIWSTDNKQATYLSSTNFLTDTDYEVSIGFTRYNDNVVRFLYQQEKNYVISAEVKGFVMTSNLKDLVLGDNKTKDFSGSFSFKRLMYLDAPVKFNEALFGSSSDSVGQSCQFSISMIKDFGGCADCNTNQKVLNNYSCQNYCALPLKNYNGVCQPCKSPECNVMDSNAFFNITMTADSKFSAYLPQTLFKKDGTLFKFENSTQTVCTARLNNTDSSLYNITILTSSGNSSCLITIDPIQTLYDVTLIVELRLNSSDYYIKDMNELVIGASSLKIAVVQTKNYSQDTVGTSLAIFILVVFFSSVVLALVYLIFITANNYMKWRLLYSINYIHLLSILFFVNTQLPVLLNSFVWTLYNVLVHSINGVFNTAILEAYKTDPDFNLFSKVTDFPRFVYNNITAHFILNFLLIIVFHLLVGLVYSVLKVINRLLRNKEKTKLSSIITRGIRAFEWNVTYYSISFFFVEIIFFALLNFFNGKTGFHLVNASIAMSIFYVLIAIGMLFFLVYIPRQNILDLDQRTLKRSWGFLFTNYRQMPIQKYFEFMYHIRNALLIGFLVFAYNSPLVQTIGMLVVFILCFVGPWILGKPWKSWLMWIIELIPETCLGLILLGYLILAVQENGSDQLDAASRASVGSFITCFCFIGVLFNALSIVFWFIFNWRYRTRVFRTYVKVNNPNLLIFQTSEYLVYQAHQKLKENFDSNSMSAKTEPNSQRVPLKQSNKNPEIQIDEEKNQQNFYYQSRVIDSEFRSDFKRGGESHPLAQLKSDSEVMYSDYNNFYGKSNNQRLEQQSVQTAEENGLPRPQQKVMDGSSIDNEEDENLNASDSLDVPYRRPGNPGLQDSNGLSQSRYREEQKSPFSQKGQKGDLVTRTEPGLEIQNSRGNQENENAPIPSDEDYY